MVILASLAIAGCTLATAVAAGLADRKRPFSLLRLTGARLAMLRRVVALEGAVPLLAVAAVSIGVGLRRRPRCSPALQLEHPLVAPGAAYYLLIAAGIAGLPRHHRGHVPAAARASPAPKSRETNERRPARSARRRPREIAAPVDATDRLP